MHQLFDSRRRCGYCWRQIACSSLRNEETIPRTQSKPLISAPSSFRSAPSEKQITAGMKPYRWPFRRCLLYYIVLFLTKPIRGQRNRDLLLQSVKHRALPLEAITGSPHPDLSS